MPQHSSATYKKLRDGTWGVWIMNPSVSVQPGDKVTVTKKSGETKVETVCMVIATMSRDDSSLVLASIERKIKEPSEYKREWEREGYERQKRWRKTGNRRRYGEPHPDDAKDYS